MMYQLDDVLALVKSWKLLDVPTTPGLRSLEGEGLDRMRVMVVIGRGEGGLVYDGTLSNYGGASMIHLRDGDAVKIVAHVLDLQPELAFVPYHEKLPSALHMLGHTLELMVMMGAFKVRALPSNLRAARLRACARYVFEHGHILFQGGGEGTAEAASHLGEATAIMSFAPGGITIFGVHFEHKE